MKLKLHTLLLVLVIVPVLHANAQISYSIDFKDSIQYFNLSSLWIPDTVSNSLEGQLTAVQVPEPIGFIGDDYQRLYIHYDRIAKGKPYEYLITGKLRRGDIINDIRGTITVGTTRLSDAVMDGGIRRGQIQSDVKLFESTGDDNGYIIARMTTYFYLDSSGTIRYDAIEMFTPNYANNQHRGIWTNYKTGETKKCNWGDYRVPESGDLDVGTKEFTPNQKYLPNGWNSYMLATMGPRDEETVKLAVMEEAKKWWEEGANEK